MVRVSVDFETMDFGLFLVGSLDFWIPGMAYSSSVRFQALLSALKFQGMVALFGPHEGTCYF
jgi:hypothetical protein